MRSRRMREEAKANAEADNKAKEKVDKINTADSMIFTTEKQLKEFGDKLPADKKPAIESALAKLKEAHKSQDVDAIDKALAELNLYGRLHQKRCTKLHKAQISQHPNQVRNNLPKETQNPEVMRLLMLTLKR
jgi:molecular chaperone DnaK